MLIGCFILQQQARIVKGFAIHEKSRILGISDVYRNCTSIMQLFSSASHIVFCDTQISARENPPGQLTYIPSFFIAVHRKILASCAGFRDSF